MEQMVEFLKEFNIQTVLTMVLVAWYFSTDIKASLERHQDRTYKLYEMFIELQKEIKEICIKTAVIEEKIKDK